MKTEVPLTRILLNTSFFAASFFKSSEWLAYFSNIVIYCSDILINSYGTRKKTGGLREYTGYQKCH